MGYKYLEFPKDSVFLGAWGVPALGIGGAGGRYERCVLM